MKQQGHRAARAGCVICKRLKLLERAYLFCITMSYLVRSKGKRVLMLVIYYMILSFTFWS